MSAQKKRLQRLGSWVVRQVSGTEVPDTTSGFRAYTREAALRMTIVSEFSYTLESIIQAGKKRMAIAHVPIRTNPRVRPSRLFDSIWCVHQGLDGDDRAHLRDVRAAEGLLVHRRDSSSLSGLALAVRFLYYYFTGAGRGHVQSLILSAVLMIVGFQVLLIGLVADVISGNRKLLEDLLYRVRVLELAERESARANARARPPWTGSRRVADPSTTSVIVPAFNEGAPSPTSWRRSRRRGRGTRSSSSTMARRMTPASARAAAGAIVVRHPYNKGNGAAVKSGIRRATGDYVLIVDGDGQHAPPTRRAWWPGSAEYDLVVGARSSATQATAARRLGNAALNRLASYLTERPIPDLTSGFRAARRECLLEFLHLLPNGFSTPTTTTLAFIKAGYSVRVRAHRSRAARRDIEDQAGARRREVLPDPAEDHHDLQPAAHLRAGQPS